MHFIETALGLGALIALTLLEELRPLRSVTQETWRRRAVNLTFIAIGGALLAVVYGPLVLGSAELARRSDFGLVRWLRLPFWAGAGLGFVLLDYTLWVWHLLNHRIPFLWRFHAAHHVDLDMDATTALRFHPGELLLSVPFRALQVALIGVDVRVLLAWQTVLLVSTEFHHSNLRLPRGFESVLRRVLVTPRMHGLHHSIAPAELNSNFGILLTLWDRLHGTYLRGASDDSTVIGLAGQRDPARLGLAGSLAFPFLRGLRPPAA
ncbi:MAG: sterol desaturase family protein [Thermoleophilaceae bacterium]